MKTRPRFACCECERTFGQVVDQEGNPVLLVECPYCGAECKVDTALETVIAHRAEALGQTGKQLFHIGDYETPLTYQKQSLAIQQESGDTAGLCATRFNMGHIHWQNGERTEALRAWVTVYRLARPMSLAQALNALEGLAGQLRLPGGLDGWAALARQMDEA